MSRSRTSSASLFKCFARQGSWVRKEAESILPGTLQALPKVPGSRDPAPPLRTHLFPAQSASLHFSRSSFGLLHFLSAQCLSSFPEPHPQGPPAYPPAPDVGTGFPGPLWLGSLQVCLGPGPNQQLQVPTFPSCSHKVTIVRGTREDHPSPCCYGERMFTQGYRRPPACCPCPAATCHMQVNTYLTRAHTAGAEGGPTRHRTSLQTRNGHQGSEQAQQGHTGGLPLAEMRP